MRKITMVSALILPLMLLSFTSGRAQEDYPNKPIQLVVPLRRVGAWIFPPAFSLRS